VSLSKGWGRKQVNESLTDVRLQEIFCRDDTASRESQQEVVRTVEVSVDYDMERDLTQGNSSHPSLQTVY
jgi:hypothetical protein